MIATDNPTVTYSGNGVATTFAYGFPIQDKTEVALALTVVATNTITALVVDVDYTVNPAGIGNTDSSTWTILYPASGSSDPILPTGTNLTIIPNFPITQTSDFSTQGSFSPVIYENALDKLTLIDQQQQEQLSRTLTIPAGSTQSTDAATVLAGVLASAASCAADAASAATSATNAARYPIPPWATATAYAVNNTVIQSGQIYVCLAAHTSGVFATDLAANDWANISGLVAPVANSSLATMAAGTIKGNNTGATAAPSNLTAAQVAAMLPAFTGDTGTGGVRGSVPAPSAGDAAASKFLKADGTWQPPTNGVLAKVNFSPLAQTGCSYTRSGTVVTVTLAAHGYVSGMIAEVVSATDTGVNSIGNVITVTGVNTFTFATTAGGANGTLTIRSIIKKQFNVASILTGVAGDYTITFANATPDTFYCLTGGASNANFPVLWLYSAGTTGAPFTKTTTQVRIATCPANNSSLVDFNDVSVVIQ